MPEVIRYKMATVTLPAHLWDRLVSAWGDNLTAWENEEDSVQQEHAELIEELNAVAEEIGSARYCYH